VTLIAFKLIGTFPKRVRSGTILSSDQPEIVAGLIPFIGMMLVLLQVHKTRCFEHGRDIVDGKSQMIDGVAIICAQLENCKSCPASSASAEVAL
jgi:hypothetical protein